MGGAPPGNRANVHWGFEPTRRGFLSLAVPAASLVTAGCGFVGSEGERTTREVPADAPTVAISIPPNSLDLGPALEHPPARQQLAGYLHALVLPVHEPTGELLTSGHSWTVDGREVTVPGVVADYEIDSDGSVLLSFDDRFTYWNGDPLDARAYWLRDRIGWLGTGGAFDDREFGGELRTDTDYRRRIGRRTAVNRFEGIWSVHPGLPPLPPSETEPELESLRSASTERQLADRYTDYVDGKIGVERLADEGYGTGPFEVESAAAVTREGMDDSRGFAVNVEAVYARRRSEYPGDPGVSALKIVGPTGPSPRSSEAAFLASGSIHAGAGVIDELGDFAPESVADGIEQVATYPSPVGACSILVFNWANPHLRRLWVRRALVAAAPFDSVVGNVDGASVTSPPIKTGLPSRVDRRVFGSEFLASLHEYPVAADRERASDWLSVAGYREDSGAWVDPDGEAIALEFVVNGSRDEVVATTLASGLESLGVDVEISTVSGQQYRNRLLGGEFDLAVATQPGGWGLASFYGDRFDAGNGWLSTSVLTAVRTDLSTCRDDATLAWTPGTVTLPRDPGLRIEGVDYPDGGRTYRWPDAGTDLSVCGATGRLTESGLDVASYREAARTCARWYNYAVPTVLFAQDRAGLWAHSGRFTFPGSDQPAAEVARQVPTSPQHYHLLSGTLQARTG